MQNRQNAMCGLQFILQIDNYTKNGRSRCREFFAVTHTFNAIFE